MKAIFEIWAKWNKKQIGSEEALIQMGKYIQPKIVQLEKQRAYTLLQGACVCGHGKRQHGLLDPDNTCSSCYLKGDKCKAFRPKKR